MASSFWNGEFYWNGIHSSQYNVCIVDFDNNSILKQSSLNHNVELNEEISINGKKWFSEAGRNADNIVIQLCKTNGTQWQSAELINLNRWFFTEKFCKFVTTDYNDNSALNIVYYLKAVKFTKYVNKNFYGYVEIEFQSYDGLAYVIPNTTYTISNGETKNVYSYSNLYIPYKPKLEVTNYGGSSTTITISNSSTNTSLEIQGLSTNETVIIDCQMGTVLNLSGVNRFDVLQNYNFIKMQNGDNNIRLSGNAKVQVICEFPIII